MNPITNARIVSIDTDPSVYHRTRGGPRGAPDHIMSNSELKRVLNCPQKWFKGVPESDTESTRWGTLVDCLALTPDHFRERYAVTPETYPDSKTGAPKDWNWNANFCKSWRDGQGDKIVTRPDEVAGANDAVGRLWCTPEVKALLENSEKQVMVVGEYQDADTGLVVPLKGLIDIVPAAGVDFYGKCLADLKTTEKASVRGWAKKVFLWGMHIQASLYLDLYTAATGEDRSDFLHVISESEPPYEPNTVLLTSGSDMDFVELGRETYLHALGLYCRCIKEGHWPGYAEMSDQRIHGWAVVQPEAWMIGAGAVRPPDVSPEDEEPETKVGKDDIMP